jgi:hypothetical protein
MWGDVNKPIFLEVRYLSDLATFKLTVPFPFVPAIWINLNYFCQFFPINWISNWSTIYNRDLYICSVFFVIIILDFNSSLKFNIQFKIFSYS